MSELLPLTLNYRYAYRERAYRLTHPDYLATVGILFGLRPESPTNCRVLELGCGSGVNILPLAYTMPESSFIGIDLSEQLLSDATERRNRLNLKNITFRQADLSHLDLGDAEFDYIICHNVFSYVPEKTQERIFRVIGAHLSPNGLATINYNTYPGWHTREAARALLNLNVEAGNPAFRLEQARKFSLWFSTVLSQAGNASSHVLRTELARLLSLEDWQVVNEFLGPAQRAVYFEELAEMAKSKGLQYVADAAVARLIPGEFNKEVQGELLRGTATMVEYEQTLDFLRNAASRRSIFCRTGQVVKRALRPELLQHFFVSSRWRPEEPEIRESGPQVFVHPTGKRFEIFETERVKALHFLHEHYPQAVPVPDFVEYLILNNPSELDRMQLLKDLTQAFFSGFLDFYMSAPACSRVFSERPRASAIARCEAEHSMRVTNLRHETVQLDTVEHALLTLCDGTRTLPELRTLVAAHGVEAVEKGFRLLLEHGLIHAAESGSPSLIVH